MKGLKVGHYSDHEAGTGASVFLFDQPAPGAFHLAGASPATFDVMVLDLYAEVSHVDGLAFLGGSALGLPAIRGMQRYLMEMHRGWPAPQGRVPIVPAAAIYDLAFKQPIPVKAEGVYQACLAAKEHESMHGQIGAGTGATLGKLFGPAQPGGLGSAHLTLPSGLEVLVYAVVNPVGDVIDAKGHVLAGAKNVDQVLQSATQFLLSGQTPDAYATNTTLIAIFTNANLTKPALKRVAMMATSGIAQAVSPVFTQYDGDIVFCFSLGMHPAAEITVGALAVQATQLAIRQAIIET